MHQLADWRICSFGSERIYFKGEIEKNEESRMMFESTRIIMNKSDPANIAVAFSIEVIFKGREFKGVEITDRKNSLTVKMDASLKLITDESLEKNPEAMKLAREYEEKTKASVPAMIGIVQKAISDKGGYARDLFFPHAIEIKKFQHKKTVGEEDSVIMEIRRYSFREKSEFNYLTRRGYKEDLEKWKEVGRAISSEGSINWIDMQLIFVEEAGAQRGRIRTDLPYRIRYLVDNGALNETLVTEEISTEKLKKLKGK
ncbi:hypothetical protein H0N98_04855 [Candidatus Micrarchaeota archaeon]|nr:hypothetical protein [Candidatus Micrarchaeota archaeon]